jgi:hypothetical protein
MAGHEHACVSYHLYLHHILQRRDDSGAKEPGSIRL